MFHSSVTEHAVSCPGPRTVNASAVGELVERLTEVFGASIPPLNVKLLAASSRDRCNPAKRCQAICVGPAFFLRTERTEQPWRKRWPGASEACEEVSTGMLLHRFSDFQFELANGLLD